MFSDGLDEFDSARYITLLRKKLMLTVTSNREVVHKLVEEYQLMEDADYSILSEVRR